MASMKRKKTCSYCRSSNIKHPTITPLRSAIRYYATSFFIPGKLEKIEKYECVHCNKCGRDYQRMKYDKEILKKFKETFHPGDTYMATFRTIFPRKSIYAWVDNVRDVVQPEKNVLHIIFILCKKLLFLDCKKIDGRFIIYSLAVIK